MLNILKVTNLALVWPVGNLIFWVGMEGGVGGYITTVNCASMVTKQRNRFLLSIPSCGGCRIIIGKNVHGTDL